MLARLDLVDHGDGVVGITDDRLSIGAERQLFAAEDVTAGALAVCLEVARGRDVGPLDVIARTQFFERLGHGRRQRLEGVGEIRRVGDGNGVLGVDVERARAAYDKQARIGSGEAVAKVRKRGRVLVERFGRPGAERINDGVKARKVRGRDVHDVLDDGLLGACPVPATHEGGDIHTARSGLLHDELAGLAVGCDDCNLFGHDSFPFIRATWCRA